MGGWRLVCEGNSGKIMFCRRDHKLIIDYFRDPAAHLIVYHLSSANSQFENQTVASPLPAYDDIDIKINGGSYPQTAS